MEIVSSNLLDKRVLSRLRWEYRQVVYGSQRIHLIPRAVDGTLRFYGLRVYEGALPHQEIGAGRD